MHLAYIIKPKNYLEVGIFKCGLFNKMYPYAEQLTGVDISEISYKYMKKDRKNRFICSESNSAFEILMNEGKFFDLIFIDADHSKESVKMIF